MNTTTPKTPKQVETWPRKITVGRETVSVYRRKTPLGNFAFMVANTATGKRRFDSYASEGEAIEAARTLARKLSARDAIGAAMTRKQALEYASAVEMLQP